MINKQIKKDVINQDDIQTKFQTYIYHQNKANDDKNWLQQQLDEQIADEKDIERFLQRKLQHNHESIQHLQSIVTIQKRKIQNHEDAIQEKILELERQHEINKLTHTNQSKMLKKTLFDMKEMEKLKDTIEEQKRKLESKLKEHRMIHAKQTLELDRLNLKMKEKIKRSMIDKIIKTKDTLHDQTPYMIQQTKKKERDRHFSLAETLQHQSKLVTDIMGRSQKLDSDVIKTKQKLDISTQIVAKTKKKERNHEKKVTKLEDRLLRLGGDFSNLHDRCSKFEVFIKSNTSSNHEEDFSSARNELKRAGMCMNLLSFLFLRPL